MNISSLKSLHASMLQQNIDIQNFIINIDEAGFSCIFSTRENPFCLTMTSRGNNPIFLKFEVHTGYYIKPYFGDNYYDLVDVLGRNKDNKLMPKQFLEELNSKIPTMAKTDYIPSPNTIARLRHDLEENEKPFFDTFRKLPKGQRQTKENYLKTLAVLGKEAAEFCKKNDRSTRWSEDYINRTWKEESRKLY